MAITAVTGVVVGMGRIAPVPDRLKYAPSNGALHLEYLRARAEHLEYMVGYSRSFDLSRVTYDRECYQVQCALRRHGAYLIESGVR